MNLAISVIDREEGCGKETEIAQGLCVGGDQRKNTYTQQRRVSCIYMQVNWVNELCVYRMQFHDYKKLFFKRLLESDKHM